MSALPAEPPDWMNEGVLIPIDSDTMGTSKKPNLYIIV